MHVSLVFVALSLYIQVDVFTVGGTGFSANGSVSRETGGGGTGPQALSGHQSVVSWLCRCASICNEAHLNIIPQAQDGCHYERMGEPTEAALLVLVEKLGLFSDEQIAARVNTQRTVATPTPFWYIAEVLEESFTVMS